MSYRLNLWLHHKIVAGLAACLHTLGRIFSAAQARDRYVAGQGQGGSAGKAGVREDAGNTGDNFSSSSMVAGMVVA